MRPIVRKQFGSRDGKSSRSDGLSQGTASPFSRFKAGQGLKWSKLSADNGDSGGETSRCGSGFPSHTDNLSIMVFVVADVLNIIVQASANMV